MRKLLAVAFALLLPFVAHAQPTPTYTWVKLSPQSGTPSGAANGVCWTQIDGLHCYYNGAAHGPALVSGGVVPLTVGNTTIASGTTTRVLYDNAGVLGEYTNTQLTALINSFSSSLSGAAPASGGGTTNFLRADGTWAAPISPPLSVANGGTGLTSGTSGGVLAFTGSTTIASSGALSASNPVIGGGAGVAPSSGSRSGNTTSFATNNGALTSGNCLTADASGNVVTTGSPCGTGSGTVSTSGSPVSGNLTKFSGASAITNGDLSGDATTSGTLAVTVGKVNAVTYPSGPSANTVPVVTSATSGGTVTYEAVPNAALANSSMTIAGHSISLGGTQTIACGDLSNGATGCSTATGTSGATIPLLNAANTWSGVQSHNSGDLALKGATSGTITLNAAATAGTSTITLPGGTTDFSATGGTSQVVKQTSSGAAFTVGQLACSDLSNGASGCSTATGTSGATIPLLNAANTWSNSQAGSITTLAISTATFTPDASNNHYKIVLVHASCPCTLANPSPSFVAGTSGVIEVVQSSSGSDTIGTWGTSYLAPGGTSTITLSTGANAIDVLSYFVVDSTHILLLPSLNYSH